jgi:hypothetical protein
MGRFIPTLTQIILFIKNTIILSILITIFLVISNYFFLKKLYIKYRLHILFIISSFFTLLLPPDLFLLLITALILLLIFELILFFIIILNNYIKVLE